MSRTGVDDFAVKSVVEPVCIGRYAQYPGRTRGCPASSRVDLIFVCGWCCGPEANSVTWMKGIIITIINRVLLAIDNH